MAEKKKPSKLQIVRDAKPAVTAKQLTETIAKLREQHGKGVLMKLSGKQIDRSIAVIPTGSIQLDYALGVGGYPRGRIVEVYGSEGGGKTTLCLHAIAQAQKAKGVCVFIDAEHALDVRYAKQLGVRVQDLLISQPDYGEQGLEVADALCRSGAVTLIVIDSVAALTPKAELDGDMGDTHMGLQARMMSQAMRKLASVAGQTGTTIIFINQIRHKIGVMYGSPEVTTGGNALKYYASVRIDVRRAKGLIQDSSGKDIGGHAKLKVVKNKVAPPFQECEVDIIWGTGIHAGADVLAMASDLSIVERSGSWYSFKGARIGQGWNNAANYLVENEDTQQQIRAEIALAMGESD